MMDTKPVLRFSFWSNTKGFYPILMALPRVIRTLVEEDEGGYRYTVSGWHDSYEAFFAYIQENVFTPDHVNSAHEDSVILGVDLKEVRRKWDESIGYYDVSAHDDAKREE